MSNNSCKTASLIINDFTEKNWGRYMHLHEIEPLFKIFYTFAWKKIFLPVDWKFPGKIAAKYMENLTQASWEI